MGKEKKPVLTARQFADVKQRPYQTVMGWLQSGLVPGAKLVESPIGNYYEIPADVAESFEPPKRGRPKKAASEGAAGQPQPVKKARKKGN